MKKRERKRGKKERIKILVKESVSKNLGVKLDCPLFPPSIYMEMTRILVTSCF